MKRNNLSSHVHFSFSSSIAPKLPCPVTCCSSTGSNGCSPGTATTSSGRTASSSSPSTGRDPIKPDKRHQKAGHFTIFIRLLQATQEDNHLYSALNDSSCGIIIFAPSDNAFSGLRSGTLNTLSDGDNAELVKFHVVPTFLSTSQFQTVSNPLETWAGTGSRLPLNVTLYPNSVNITTGLTNTSISSTVYTDNQLAIYRIEKVLLPMDIFASMAPAPAPVAPPPEKPKMKAPV